LHTHRKRMPIKKLKWKLPFELFYCFYLQNLVKIPKFEPSKQFICTVANAHANSCTRKNVYRVMNAQIQPTVGKNQGKQHKEFDVFEMVSQQQNDKDSHCC
jgi:hypothetical protein